MNVKKRIYKQNKKNIKNKDKELKKNLKLSDKKFEKKLDKKLSSKRKLRSIPKPIKWPWRKTSIMQDAERRVALRDAEEMIKKKEALRLKQRAEMQKKYEEDLSILNQSYNSGSTNYSSLGKYIY